MKSAFIVFPSLGFPYSESSISSSYSRDSANAKTCGNKPAGISPVV